ncbi:YcxB family protein [Streptomyces sp. NRRL F-5123]|uniref:YcxB family protein n=1 Tax=Streptomyces sp. NRRL F-5123 TaxID=1463856 RepID=UPI0004E1AF8B|nr:YcxB family protein [Streptomyces sp. NRRL F-5123]
MAETLITTTFVTTPDTVLRSYRACARSGYIQRVVVTGGLMAAGVVVMIAGFVAARAAVPVGAVLVVYGAGFFLLRERSVRRQLAPYLGGAREVTVTMTDTEYRTQSPDLATARTWRSFRSVSRVGDFRVLRLSPRMAMGLPVEALDERQTAAFLELLREKGLYAAAAS